MLRPVPVPVQVKFRWVLFKDTLRIGLVGTISTVATNLAIGVTTALVGGFGTAASPEKTWSIFRCGERNAALASLTHVFSGINQPKAYR